MAHRPDTSTAPRTLRGTGELRGAGGLRGVRSRQGGRGRGSRPSSGRGPSPRGRWDRSPRHAVAVDRVEVHQLDTLAGPIVMRLVGPLSTRPLPMIVAFGAGGRRAADLAADELWARDLADETGALVLLCGYRRADEHEARTDAAAAWAAITALAERLGGRPGQAALTGRGAGFRLAARLAADADAWPSLPTPAACVAASPVVAAATILRAALALPTVHRPSHAPRIGAEVLTRDGHRLGWVADVGARDMRVSRGLTAAQIAVPLSAVDRTQGAVTLSLRAAELVLRD